MGRRLVAGFYELDEMFRFHQLGFVTVTALLGLACTSAWSTSAVIAILVVSFFFNSFGVILNDVVDLPVDRTAPLRRRSMLVRGRLTPQQALLVCGAQIPLMLAAHMAGGLSRSSMPLLVAVTASLTVYDLWSKTSRVPLLIDGALAFSGFLYVLYGSRVVQPSIPELAWAVALSEAAYLLYVNAFSNGLRDLDNDLACCRCTTPIWLGCRGTVAGRVHTSRRMYAYAALLQATLIALPVYVAIQGSTDSGSSAMGIRGVALASAINVTLFLFQYNAPQQRWAILMRIHLLLLPVPLMLALITRLSASGSVTLFAIYLIPVIVLAPLLTGRLPAALPGEAPAAEPVGSRHST